MRFTICLVAGLLAGSARAEIVVFDFATSGGSNAAGLTLDTLGFGSFTVNGSNFSIELGAAADTFGGPGIDLLNYTTSSPNFGINAGGAGDVTDAIDGGSGFNERLLLNFVPFSGSGPVTMKVVSIDFDRVTSGGNDRGRVSFGLGPDTIFEDADLNGSDLLTLNQSIATSESLEIQYELGNGFGLEAITLDITVIPEPATANLAVLGLLLVARRVKRTTRIAAACS